MADPKAPETKIPTDKQVERAIKSYEKSTDRMVDDEMKKVLVPALKDPEILKAANEYTKSYTKELIESGKLAKKISDDVGLPKGWTLYYSHDKKTNKITKIGVTNGMGADHEVALDDPRILEFETAYLEHKLATLKLEKGLLEKAGTIPNVLKSAMPSVINAIKDISEDGHLEDFIKPLPDPSREGTAQNEKPGVVMPASVLAQADEAMKNLTSSGSVTSLPYRMPGDKGQGLV